MAAMLPGTQGNEGVTGVLLFHILHPRQLYLISKINQFCIIRIAITLHYYVQTVTEGLKIIICNFNEVY